jgi:4-hydroxy-tetrahydrodipicolinate synthase
MTVATSLQLGGVIPPMITPLTASGAIDGPGIGRLVEALLAAGVAGIFVLGSSGEGPWLTATEREQVIALTARAIAGRAPLLAGVIEPSTARTVEAIRQAEAAGADAVVVASPYYFQVEATDQIAHVEAAARASQLPLVLYNIPGMTRNPIAPATVRRLLPIETLVALKDSAGDMEQFVQFLALRDEKPALRVFQGAERLAAPALLAGADGLVPGLGNLAPRLFVRMVAATRAGDEATAYELQAQAEALWAVHSHSFWLEGLKYAAALLGFGSAACAGRGPTLSEHGRAAIRRLVERAAGPATQPEQPVG